MTREHNLLFRAHVPALVHCLEDADGIVRETAKATVIELFQYAIPLTYNLTFFSLANERSRFASIGAPLLEPYPI